MKIINVEMPKTFYTSGVAIPADSYDYQSVGISSRERALNSALDGTGKRSE